MNGKIILLVEDNPDDVELTLRALMKNHILAEVVLVRDGAEALDYLNGAGTYTGRDATCQPTLILLDLKLPKLSGLEVLARVRNDDRTRMVPVVILTSSREEQDVIEGYRRGANSYVRKPVDYEQFNETVRQMGVYWLNVNFPPPRLRS